MSRCSRVPPERINADLEKYNRHHRLDRQQHRRRLQAGHHARLRHRLGQPQRRRIEQHLPGKGRAAVQAGPRHRVGLPDRFSAGGKCVAVSFAEEGEYEEEGWREGLLGGGEDGEGGRVVGG